MSEASEKFALRQRRLRSVYQGKLGGAASAVAKRRRDFKNEEVEEEEEGGREDSTAQCRASASI